MTSTIVCYENFCSTIKKRQKFKIFIKFFFIQLFFLSMHLSAGEDKNIIELDGKQCTLKDWFNPSRKDYEIMQEFLQNTLDYRLKYVSDLRRRDRIINYRMFDSSQEIEPYFQIDNFGNPNSSDAIILYCSQNHEYLIKLERLKRYLKKFNFHGHVLFHVGGWPNIEGGCLKHFMMPYMFKTCEFMEAKRLGYKRVLWMDLSLVPVQNLTPLFDYISQHDCIFRLHHDSFSVIASQNDQKIFSVMNLTKEEKQNQIQVDSRVLGLNLESSRICDFLEKWHQKGIEGVFFLSNLPEELPMSILLNRMGFINQSHDFNLIREMISWDYPPSSQKTFFHVRYDIED